MAFHIRDEDTDRAVRRLAKATGKTLTQAIRDAVENEYKRASQAIPLVERLKPLQARYRSFRKTGWKPDKRFFDELSGDP
jgi:antitoxin VapB